MVIHSSMGSGAPIQFKFEEGMLGLAFPGGGVRIGLGLGGMVTEGGPLALAPKPATFSGELAGTDGLTVEFHPIALPDQGTLSLRSHLIWLPGENLLRKRVSYRFTHAVHIREVQLDVVPLSESLRLDHGIPPHDAYKGYLNCNSLPACFDTCFMGVEFPCAVTHSDGETLVLAHAPFLQARPGVWYDCRPGVYGLAEADETGASAFQAYLHRHILANPRLHFNYNSWWTAPYPSYNQQDILALMGRITDNLQPRGASFDSFTIDLGWSNPQSIWQVDGKTFPQGFDPLLEVARRGGSELGLWFSPSACYLAALDIDWAQAQGCFAQQRPWNGHPLQALCLAEGIYAGEMTAHLTEIVRRYGIRQVKVDGLFLDCPGLDHGHAPGLGAVERGTEALITLFESLRRASPGLWIETTCMHEHPSPWWLMHVHSVTGAYGDDAPHGRCPAPVYREAYTSARDYYNLQGRRSGRIPAAHEDLLGLIHQTPDDFMNDAVTVLLRGNRFISAYVNPGLMDGGRWDRLADWMKWARKNEHRLGEGRPLFFSSWREGGDIRITHGPMPRQPYGYAHGDLWLLRNPWVAHTRMTVEAPAGGPWDMIGLYPEVRCFARNIEAGSRITIPLLPYETLVLSAEPAGAGDPLPQYVPEFLLPREGCRLERLSRGDFAWTWDDALPEGVELLLLLEGTHTPLPLPDMKIFAEDVPVSHRWSGTNTGWDACMLTRQEHWMFAIAPLPGGTRRLRLHGGQLDAALRSSAYLWRRRRGDAEPPVHHGNALPPPEWLSLEAVGIL